MVSVGGACAQGVVDRALAVQALKHTDYGLRLLREHQQEDGSWNDSVATTALALRAFLESYQGYSESDGAFVTRPLTYLLDHAAEDGAISDRKTGRARDTATVMLALHATDNPRYTPVVQAAAGYLIRSQGSADNGIPETDARYGAVGAHEDAPPSLETQYWALEALTAAGVDLPQGFRNRAAAFISQLQNSRPGKDESGADYAGGFVSAPEQPQSGASRATATMTHAAVAALRDVGIPDTDPRVEAARRWIADHYSGGLPVTAAASPDPFLFFDAFVRSMVASGQPVIETPKGGTHNWRNDAISTLLELHRPDGSWGVRANAVLSAETDPVLSTARSVNALNRIIHSWR
ncbi:hypothetical protein CKO31_07195 [Thiohalocapsa halophila]|uniref:Terpene cyclase/mutase family protein n=1 Tax=Thiohalocapsa halophila TaxID=69359 RepID=A0ABS1CF63_9GAMM|nr:hypothetical protein [Thiohalocapsa halophila]